MSNKKSNPIAIIIFCLYFVTIFVYGYSLYNQYKNGPERIESIEIEIIKAINSCMKYSEPGSEEFAQKLLASESIKKYTEEASDLYAMTLAYNDELIYSFPSDLNQEEFSITSPLVVLKHDTLYTQSGNPLKYAAAYYYLSPNVIFTNGRVTFFVLLVLTFLAAIFLILAYAKEPQEEIKFENDLDTEAFISEEDFTASTPVKKTSAPQQNKSHIVMHYKDTRPARDELFTSLEKEDFDTNHLPDEKSSTTILFQEGNNISSYEETSDSLPETAFQNQVFPEETDETVLLQKQMEEDFGHSASDYENNFAESAETQDYNEYEEEKKDIIFLTPENATLPGEDDSVYSKVTGFGKEQYMLSQLNSELVEVTSEEEDLTIFIIKLPGLSRECEASKKICDFIKQMDGAQDFVFEYKNDGYTFIMPTIDINYALTLSDGIHKGIVEILNTYGYEPFCFIGISSKSVRIITGERLVREAEQALIHAQEEENSPIIAFRVDPEKYRSYIAQEAKKIQEPQETPEFQQ